MKLNFISNKLFILLLTFFSFIHSATAGLINGSINVDNQHWAYISTSDSIQGIEVSSGNNWGIANSFSYSLDAGTNYFLHIKAEDVGGPAGFLGDFSFTGGDHVFSNNDASVLTNTSDWQVSTSGWGSYGSSTGYGVNGVGPWGYRSGVSASAEWIWTSDNEGDNLAYFTIAINAVDDVPDVPEPNILFLFGIVVITLGVKRFISNR